MERPAVGWLFAEPFKAAQSVTSPSEGLYTFTYEGDYGFDEFLDAHPEIDLKDLDTFDAGNLAEVNYLLGLVIINLTIEKGAYPLLKEAMNSVETDNQMRKFIANKLGIAVKDINSTFRNIIDSNKY